MKCENCKLNGKTVRKCRVEVIPKNGECNLDEKIVEKIAAIDEKVERFNNELEKRVEDFKEEIEKLVEDLEEEIDNRHGEGFAKLVMEIKKMLKVIGE